MALYARTHMPVGLMSKSWFLVLGGGPVLRTSAPVRRTVTSVPSSGPLPLSSDRVRHDKQGSPCPRSQKTTPTSNSARSYSPFDRRLDELDLLDLRELRLRVALQAPAPDRSRASGRQALLMMVCHQLDSRAWTMSWNDRGIRILHDHHHVTLGVAKTFVSYIEGTDSVGRR